MANTEKLVTYKAASDSKVQNKKDEISKKTADDKGKEEHSRVGLSMAQESQLKIKIANSLKVLLDQDKLIIPESKEMLADLKTIWNEADKKGLRRVIKIEFRSSLL